MHSLQCCGNLSIWLNVCLCVCVCFWGAWGCVLMMLTKLLAVLTAEWYWLLEKRSSGYLLGISEAITCMEKAVSAATALVLYHEQVGSCSIHSKDGWTSRNYEYFLRIVPLTGRRMCIHLVYVICMSVISMQIFSFICSLAQEQSPIRMTSDSQ